MSEKFAGAFRVDRVTNLITRLQYNVIRTGLRRINLAYSRISIKVGGWEPHPGGGGLKGGKGAGPLCCPVFNASPSEYSSLDYGAEALKTGQQSRPGVI